MSRYLIADGEESPYRVRAGEAIPGIHQGCEVPIKFFTAFRSRLFIALSSSFSPSSATPSNKIHDTRQNRALNVARKLSSANAATSFLMLGVVRSYPSLAWLYLGSTTGTASAARSYNPVPASPCRSHSGRTAQIALDAILRTAPEGSGTRRADGQHVLRSWQS